MARVLAAAWIALVAVPAPAAEGEEQKKDASFKVVENMFARSVNLDHDGKCKATSGVKLKAWYVATYPAVIPPFESCTTISSETARGAVDIKLSIVRRKKTVTKIDGVLDLGTDGRATQAIDWDHVEIPGPGTYHLVIKIEGKNVARFPMHFRKRKSGKKQDS